MHQNSKETNKDFLESTQKQNSSETKIFDLSSIDVYESNDNNYKNMSKEELELLLQNNNISWIKKRQIKKIMKNK